jgi:predicted secreted Zn-dependent protease
MHFTFYSDQVSSPRGATQSSTSSASQPVVKKEKACVKDLGAITAQDINVTSTFHVLHRSILFTSSRGNLVFIAVIAAENTTALLMGTAARATEFFPKIFAGTSYTITSMDVSTQQDLTTLYLADTSSITALADDVPYTQEPTLATSIKKQTHCYVKGIIRRVFVNTYNVCTKNGQKDAKCLGVAIKPGEKCKTCKSKTTKECTSITIDMADRSKNFKASIMPGYVLNDLMETLHVAHASRLPDELSGSTVLMYVAATKGLKEMDLIAKYVTIVGDDSSSDDASSSEQSATNGNDEDDDDYQDSDNSQ